MSNRKGYKKRGSSYARKKRFMRSQKAHLRLIEFHSRNDDIPGSRAKRHYHGGCYDEQKRLGRVLTRAERKKLYAFWLQY